jgi:hypothetical protein
VVSCWMMGTDCFALERLWVGSERTSLMTRRMRTEANHVNIRELGNKIHCPEMAGSTKIVNSLRGLPECDEWIR